MLNEAKFNAFSQNSKEIFNFQTLISITSLCDALRKNRLDEFFTYNFESRKESR